MEMLNILRETAFYAFGIILSLVSKFCSNFATTVFLLNCIVFLARVYLLLTIGLHFIP
jgi:hypothetical protein